MYFASVAQFVPSMTGKSSIKISSTTVKAMSSVSNSPNSPSSNDALIIAPIIVIVVIVMVLGVVCGIIATVAVVMFLLRRNKPKHDLEDEHDTLQFKDLANPIYTSMLCKVVIRIKFQYIAHKQVIVPAFIRLLLIYLITLNSQVTQCITLLGLQSLPVLQVAM